MKIQKTGSEANTGIPVHPEERCQEFTALPCLGSSVGWSIVPIGQGYRFNPTVRTHTRVNQ